MCLLKIQSTLKNLKNCSKFDAKAKMSQMVKISPKFQLKVPMVSFHPFELKFSESSWFYVCIMWSNWFWVLTICWIITLPYPWCPIIIPMTSANHLCVVACDYVKPAHLGLNLMTSYQTINHRGERSRAVLALY